MTPDEIKKQILTDMKVQMLSEYDKNFERKAFFSQSWKNRRREGKGSLMNVHGGGGLRGSLKGLIQASSVSFRSGKPYAQILNEGGDIVVTARMKRFFWAKYYELSGKITYKKDSKDIRKSSIKISDEAEFYRNMALMKVGSKIHIPKRQYIGHAPEVDKVIKKIFDSTLTQRLEAALKQGIK